MIMSVMHITHGADSSASLSQQAQAGNDVLNTANSISNLLDVATELLSQSERRRVLHSGDVKDC